MQLSPTVRWLLTGLAAGVTALSTALAAYETIPPAVGVTIAVVSAVLAGLNIVPPQVGGTQQGVVNPSITTPPPADVDLPQGEGYPVR